MKWIRYVALTCAALLPASLCFANSPFVADTVSSGAGAPPPLVISSSQFDPFVSSIIDATGAFTSLNGYANVSTISVLGVTHAISLTEDVPGTTVTMAIPVIGFSRTFTGTTRDAVWQQIRTFTRTSGLWGEFLAALAKQSPNAVTDGNPNSATGTMAASTFAMEGFTPAGQLFPGLAGKPPSLAGFAIGFDGGHFTAGGLSGTLADFAIPKTWQLSDNVGLTLNLPLSYLSVGGARVYGGGLTAAVPIQLKRMDSTNRWNWRIAPLFGFDARASQDLVAAAALWQVGLSNSVDYRARHNLIFSLVNQLGYYRSFRISIGGTNIDPKVNQEILKDGLRVSALLTRRLIGDVFVIESDYLQKAAVSNFTTFGGSLRVRVTPTMNVGLAANIDTGPSFRSWSVGLRSAWRF